MLSRVLLGGALLLVVTACGSSRPASRAAPAPGSSDAGVQPAPQRAPLVDEAGFLEVPAQPTAARYAARMFYAFQAADDDAAHKPLIVLFNGGPGYPTSIGLLAYGTGRYTLDASLEGGGAPLANPARWTAFANLLYLDARQAGFSYGLLPGTTDCKFSEVEDAADFVHALLSFFDAHPALRANPVVVAGESYGGVRASWMLDLILRYGTEAVKGGGRDLTARLQAHFDAVFPDRAGQILEEASIAEQFGAQVLIEPLVLGGLQYDEQRRSLANDPYVGHVDGAWFDGYDVRMPVGYSQLLDKRALSALGDGSGAARLLGVGLDAIPLLAPAARKDAFHASQRSTKNVDALNHAVEGELGALASSDAYFSILGEVCTSPWNDDGLGSANAFAANLPYVRTFITHARYDGAIYTPAIPAVLAKRGWGGDIDMQPRNGVARAGWFRVNLPASDEPARPASSVEVRFPLYESAGHMVAAAQPADLAADVQAWLAQ